MIPLPASTSSWQTPPSYSITSTTSQASSLHTLMKTTSEPFPYSQTFSNAPSSQPHSQQPSSKKKLMNKKLNPLGMYNSTNHSPTSNSGPSPSFPYPSHTQPSKPIPSPSKHRLEQSCIQATGKSTPPPSMDNHSCINPSKNSEMKASLLAFAIPPTSSKKNTASQKKIFVTPYTTSSPPSTKAVSPSLASLQTSPASKVQCSQDTPLDGTYPSQGVPCNA